MIKTSRPNKQKGNVNGNYLMDLWNFSCAKLKNRDVTIGASVRLGVPEIEAENILDTQKDKLMPMLHMTILKGSTIADKPAYERMAYCIYAIYKKQ